MILSIKVTTRAHVTEYMGPLSDGTLKIRLRAVPENGAANTELLDFLATSCKIPKDKLRIVSGKTSTRKRVELPDLSSLPWQKNGSAKTS